MKIWIVYTEYQKNTPDINGVYATKEGAEEARQELVDDFKRGGNWVYGEDQTDDVDERFHNEADWDVTIRVEEHEVEVR